MPSQKDRVEQQVAEALYTQRRRGRETQTKVGQTQVSDLLRFCMSLRRTSPTTFVRPNLLHKAWPAACFPAHCSALASQATHLFDLFCGVGFAGIIFLGQCLADPRLYPAKLCFGESVQVSFGVSGGSSRRDVA